MFITCVTCDFRYQRVLDLLSAVQQWNVCKHTGDVHVYNLCYMCQHTEDVLVCNLTLLCVISDINECRISFQLCGNGTCVNTQGMFMFITCVMCKHTGDVHVYNLCYM